METYLIKNVWDGERWKYEFKHPTTHWSPKPTLPPLSEVEEVQDKLFK